MTSRAPGRAASIHFRNRIAYFRDAQTSAATPEQPTGRKSTESHQIRQPHLEASSEGKPQVRISFAAETPGSLRPNRPFGCRRALVCSPLGSDASPGLLLLALQAIRLPDLRQFPAPRVSFSACALRSAGPRSGAEDQAPLCRAASAAGRAAARGASPARPSLRRLPRARAPGSCAELPADDAPEEPRRGGGRGRGREPACLPACLRG